MISYVAISEIAAAKIRMAVSWSAVVRFAASVAKRTDIINLIINTKAKSESFFQRIKPLKKTS